MKITSLRKKLSNYEFVYNSNIVENISNFYTIKDISPFAEDYGGGTPSLSVSLSKSSSEIRGKVA